MRLRTTVLTVLCFLFALVLSAFIAGGSATIIEKRSRLAVKIAMETGGFGWAHVETHGLQVVLGGTAPSEAERFRALTRAGTAVDASRIVDDTDVVSAAAQKAPDFSLKMLRNDDGISLIGLVPAETDQGALVARLRKAVTGGNVTDMLESADFPAPEGWQTALDFAVDTISTIPRAKISVDPGAVTVEAIADSTADKSRIETSLARRRPAGLKLTPEIAAPRPVITPFTLRFLVDAGGPRFDACSADTERARDRILAAARAAGAKGTLTCTVGMGTPSPQWADAVVMGIHALGQIGSGVITFSDADVFLSANPEVKPAALDKAVGELETNLPKVFSLKVELQTKPDGKNDAPEFTATLAQSGKVTLQGRVSDDRSRTALASVAKARFGASEVHSALRIDDTLPQGWPVRTLAALEALDTLAEGNVTVTPDLVTISGVTGDAQASDTISRVLTKALGERARLQIDVRYDRRLDPVLGLPDGPGCVSRLNDVLAQHKISFEPGSAIIAAEASDTLDALARAMKDCQDFRMEIGGHTDSQGRDEMNMALSQQRAEAVLSALQQRRVLTGNLLARGYGESQPIASNDTEDGREANRRIEFTLLDQTPVQSAPDAPDAAPDQTEAPAATEAPMDGAPMEGTGTDTPPMDGPENGSPAGDADDGSESATAAQAPAAGSDAPKTDAPPSDTGATRGQAQPDAAQGATDPGAAPAPEAPAGSDTPTQPQTAPVTDEVTTAGVHVQDASKSPRKPKPRPADLRVKRK